MHYWRTKTGEDIAVCDMTDEHIKRAMKYATGWYWHHIFEEELERREKERNKIETTYEDNLSGPHLTITLSRMPENCFECPLQASYEEDEPMWGDGVVYYCPFGGENYGCAVERPKGCPLKEGRKQNKS